MRGRRELPNQTMERTADRDPLHCWDDFHTSIPGRGRSRPPSLILFSLDHGALAYEIAVSFGAENGSAAASRRFNDGGAPRRSLNHCHGSHMVYSESRFDDIRHLSRLAASVLPPACGTCASSIHFPSIATIRSWHQASST